MAQGCGFHIDKSGKERRPLMDFPKGILFNRAESSTLDEVVFICFRFSDDTALRE